jgi:hypothetical protein
MSFSDRADQLTHGATNMALPNLLRSLLRHFQTHQAGLSPSITVARRRCRTLLQLERLESRALPSTVVVLNSLDHGPGSLRDVISNPANAGATVFFAPNVHRITLTTGELTISQNLDIEGPGAPWLTITGNQASRLLRSAVA